MPQADPTAIQVYEYLDYRAFLRDYYLHAKAVRHLSYRGFSVRAGLSSPNYLKLVIDGKRNWTQSMARRFAKAISLDRDATDYFSELVTFNQATSSLEREASYGRALGIPKRFAIGGPIRDARGEHIIRTAHKFRAMKVEFGHLGASVCLAWTVSVRWSAS
jgi:hypothetical protein